MTLYAEIQSLSPALVASKDHQAIADALSVGRVEVVRKLGGIGLVLEALGPIDGSALLDALKEMSLLNHPLKWAWYLIERGELDFGSPATRAMINEMVATGEMPGAAGAVLKAVAEVPVFVTAAEVEVAMKNDDGTDK